MAGKHAAGPRRDSGNGKCSSPSTVPAFSLRAAASGSANGRSVTNFIARSAANPAACARRDQSADTSRRSNPSDRATPENRPRFALTGIPATPTQNRRGPRRNWRWCRSDARPAPIPDRSRSAPGGFSSNRALQGTPEFAYGLSNWWEAGFVRCPRHLPEMIYVRKSLLGVSPLRAAVWFMT